MWMIHQRNSFNVPLSFTQKLLSGTTYIAPWGFSINEGGYWTNLHISWNRSTYYFCFYSRLWGNLRIVWVWKKSYNKIEELEELEVLFNDSLKYLIKRK